MVAAWSRTGNQEPTMTTMRARIIALAALAAACASWAPALAWAATAH
jgi:hypothetical protein